MGSFVSMLRNMSISSRHVGLLGTCGWSGGRVRGLKEFVQSQESWRLMEPVVEAHCSPGPEAYEACRRLGKAMIQCIGASQPCEQ